MVIFLFYRVNNTRGKKKKKRLRNFLFYAKKINDKANTNFV